MFPWCVGGGDVMCGVCVCVVHDFMWLAAR